MDVAASEFFKDGNYDLDFKTKENDGSQVVTPEGLADIYRGFCKNYPIVSIEDAFDQDDWSSWTNFMATTDIQIVGDDLTVTNPKRIKMAINQKVYT